MKASASVESKMNEPTSISAQDLITALTNQRNSAMNENAQFFAMVETLKKKIEELESALAIKG